MGDVERGPAPSLLAGPRVPAAGRVRPPGRTGVLRAAGGATAAVAAVSLGITVLVVARGHDATSGPLSVGRTAPAPVPQLLTAPVPAPAPAPVQAPAAAAPARPALTVLNNSRVRDLGRSQAARYRAGGWDVPVVGSLRGRIRASTVYYEPGQLEQAKAVAEQFGVRRVLPRLAALPGRGLTVVVTRDLV